VPVSVSPFGFLRDMPREGNRNEKFGARVPQEVTIVPGPLRTIFQITPLHINQPQQSGRQEVRPPNFGISNQHWGVLLAVYPDEMCEHRRDPLLLHTEVGTVTVKPYAIQVVVELLQGPVAHTCCLLALTQLKRNE